MGSLRVENHKQNTEIASLKETVNQQNKTINQHEITIKELISDDRPVSSRAIFRRKRPARLLPASVLRGKKKNETDEDNRKIFYGPPTNCSDLSRLGYTLNGFYQIKNPVLSDKLTKTTKLETVYCAFKQEGTYNPILVQQAVIQPPSPLINYPPSTSSSDQEIFPTAKEREKSFFPSFFNFPSSLVKPEDEGISFMASIARDRSKPYYGTLTFENEFVSDKGKPFNRITGYFRAPKVGIYHFLYEMTSFDIFGNQTNVHFYVNDITVVNAISQFNEKIPGSSKISHQVALKLNIGDTICLKAISKENKKYVTTEEDFQESIMGYLLKELPF